MFVNTFLRDNNAPNTLVTHTASETRQECSAKDGLKFLSLTTAAGSIYSGLLGAFISEDDANGSFTAAMIVCGTLAATSFCCQALSKAIESRNPNIASNGTAPPSPASDQIQTIV